MPLTYNGVTPTAIVYNGVNLSTVIMNGVTVWTAYTPTVYRWQKSYVAQTIYYEWKQYELVDTGYYAEYSWSAATPAGFSDIEGYTSLSFATTPQSGGGYSYSGFGMATADSSKVVYVGNSTSVTKYWGSGGVLYSSDKSCRWIASYTYGSELGEVQSTSSTGYPYPQGNGGDGYYYIYNRQTTVYSKGADIEVVTSTNQTAYPTNGQASGYWYTYLGTA